MTALLKNKTHNGIKWHSIQLTRAEWTFWRGHKTARTKCPQRKEKRKPRNNGEIKEWKRANDVETALWPKCKTGWYLCRDCLAIVCCFLFCFFRLFASSTDFQFFYFFFLTREIIAPSLGISHFSVRQGSRWLLMLKQWKEISIDVVVWRHHPALKPSGDDVYPFLCVSVSYKWVGCAHLVTKRIARLRIVRL